jgi:hypothetical protein
VHRVQRADAVGGRAAHPRAKGDRISGRYRLVQWIGEAPELSRQTFHGRSFAP